MVKNSIPNMITSCNLLSGSLAVMLAMEGLFHCALGMIILGAVFDFFDGFTARRLGVSGPMGVELDSLADCVTFGLAPSVMVVQSIRLSTAQSNYEWGWYAAVALIMAAFSALRLAKFNIDDRQHESFIGLPTPANALFWASLVAAFPDMPSWGAWVPWVMIVWVLYSCYLLVSEHPFFSLKFKDYSWQNNAMRYLFLIGCVILIAICATVGCIRADYHPVCFAGTACIVWYAIMSAIIK